MKDIVSHQMVLESNAGFYVGTLYWDKEMEGWFPHSRDTPYMTPQLAIKTAERWFTADMPESITT